MKKRSHFYSSLKKKIEESSISSINDAMSLFKENINEKKSSSYRLNISFDNRVKKTLFKNNLLLPNISSENNKIAVLKDGLDNEIIKTLSSYEKVKLLTLSELLPLLKRKKNKKFFFKLIAHKDSKEYIDKFKSVLSKKRVYPSEKKNTLVTDLISEVNSFDEKIVNFSFDKDANASLKFGNNKMSNDDLSINCKNAIDFFYLGKPVGFKGKFIKKISISTTNSPGIIIPVS